MKYEKVVLTVFVFFAFFAFNSDETRAQSPKSPQKVSFSNDKPSSFKEGETIIAEVKFAGLDGDYENYDRAIGQPVYESEFLLVLRDSRAVISADEKFDSRKIENVIKILKQQLAAKGYLKAEVVALGEKLPKNQMRLIFSVKRGAPVRVSEVRFVGNRNIADEEFVENLKQCSDNDWETFERRKYEYYTRKCSSSLMYSKGFFQAKIRRVTPRLVEDNYVVTIEVEEGIRFRVGEIKFRDAKIFTENELLEMLGQKTGDVVDGKALQEFVYEKLRSAYANKGYIQYMGEVDPEFIAPQAEGLDAIVNLLITIDEGQMFKLAGISFTGVQPSKIGELKQLLALKEGEVFNQEEFEKGIERINETKEFQQIDKYKDAEMRTGGKTENLYLTIKIKDKQ